MDRKLLQECPVCSTTLKVRVLQCPSCHTRIEGSFEPPRSRVMYLSSKDLEFVELFLRVRGNIREVEKAMGISYPTVRNMLDAVNEKMGYPPVRKQVETEKRREIIHSLEQGEISADKAIGLLNEETSQDQ